MYSKRFACRSRPRVAALNRAGDRIGFNDQACTCGEGISVDGVVADIEQHKGS